MADDKPNFMLPPDHPQRNRHHGGGYRDEAEFLEETLGRGRGDPDHYSDVTGEPEDTTPPKPITYLEGMELPNELEPTESDTD